MRDQVVFATPERQITPATHPEGRRGDGGDPAWESRYLVNRWWIEDELLMLRFSDGEEDQWRLALTIQADHLAGVAGYEGDDATATWGGRLGVRGTRIACEF